MQINRDSIRLHTSSSALLFELSGDTVCTFTSKEIDVVYGAVCQFANEAVCTVAYGGNYTLEPLNRFVAAYSARFNILCAEYVMPFNQCMQELMNPGSGLHAVSPDIIVFSFLLEEFAPALRGEPGDVVTQVAAGLESVESLITQTIESTSATILLTDFSVFQGCAPDFIQHYDAANLALARCCEREPRVHMVALSECVDSLGWAAAHDPRMYDLGKMMWTHDCNTLLARTIVKHLYATLGLTKKCLVVDLDNTLWGGVVGEDLPAGIRVGEGSPDGGCYYRFQDQLLGLKECGIVLAICSKNNRADVDEVFRIRSDMPLSLNDFVVTKINWEHKCDNIRAIASELNIGLDSIVFVDDNPVEIGEVNALLPEVDTLCVPTDVRELPLLFERVPFFEKHRVTDEDRRKTQLYHDNAKRAELKSGVSSLEDYLRSLKTEVVVREVTDDDSERMHQLFSKTNQFNVTTIRYSPADVERFIVDDQYLFMCVAVADIYGDLGITGLALVECSEGGVRLDSFILSCRVLGRGVETAVMNELKKRIAQDGTGHGARGKERIKAKYIPTKKNAPCKSFYEDNGFVLVDESDEGVREYECRDLEFVVPVPWITIVYSV